ncbi:serS [Symbiodinium natans]|uniref:SerS protein n=1 Tax=Symbiodinium natans TaxID=878477 RepID=A0A812THZ4_9DINO|nr:serS [Symbiodinium natans]
MPRKAAGAKLEHIAGSDLPPDAAHDIYPGHIPRTDAQVVPIAPEAPEAWEETPQNGAVRGTKDIGEVLEPVAFHESTWNVVLVLGFTEAGWLDAIISCALLLASAALQVTFSLILLSEDFLGEPFSKHLGHAEKWRRGLAHDYKHMDLSETSLVSRVCNKDDTIIVSTSQATLIGQINAFLSIKPAQFEPTELRRGILLCMLCILFWCLYLCNEFRAIGLSCEAILQVPTGARTRFEQGRFVSISRARRCVYLLARLIRGMIAGLLLYGGIVWLANTTSIKELMLNAVALGAILDVDEMFFAALMPKKVQIKIQDLEAVKVVYSRRRSQIEALLLLLFMLGLLLWPWFQLVEPLGENMKLVKKKFCDGDQNFVVDVNENQEVTIGRLTKAFSSNRNATLIEKAVTDYAFSAGSAYQRILFENDRKFERKRTQTMEAIAKTVLTCEDFGAWIENDNSSSVKDVYGPYWYSTAHSAGFPDDSTCEDMQGLCDHDGYHLLRLSCGVTCGCGKVTVNPWYKVEHHGCSKGCRDSVNFAGLPDLNCTDIPVNASSWQNFWQMYPDAVESLSVVLSQSEKSQLQGIARKMMAEGCTALLNVSEDPMTLTNFCAGNTNPELWSAAPLRQLCPHTCCSQASSASCPTACCTDTAACDNADCGDDAVKESCRRTCGLC